jgi:ribosomal RNA-processing protein 9
MSSFFTRPASERKRKRTDAQTTRPAKRRDVELQDRPTRRPGSKLPTQKTNKEREKRDESISGSDSEGAAATESGLSDSEATSEEDETAADRRVRLAQQYLDNIRSEVNDGEFDAEEIDKDLIAQRLKEDVDEVKGRQFRLISSSLDYASATACNFRMDTQSTSAVAVCPPYAYTASKDRTLIKWAIVDVQAEPQTNGDSGTRPPNTKRRPERLASVRGIKIKASASQQHGHTAPILSLAASPDGKFIATGGADKKLIVWSAENLRPLKTFTTHRDLVTGLAFAPSSSQPGAGAQMFSASMDRTLKSYSLNGEDSLAYVETLFGHQDHVTAVAAMGIDQCVSVGSRDRTARLWKVVDETQLVFHCDSRRDDQYHTGTVDCVATLPPMHFVTGSDAGTITLWDVRRKKPQFVVHTAHGVDEPEPMESVTSEIDPDIIATLKRDDTRRPIPRQITALASLPGTDIVISGSWDGWIRAWKVADDKRSLIPQGVVGRHDEVVASSGGVDANGDVPATAAKGPVRGIVNSLAMFERRKLITNEFGSTKEGECLGLCIVAGTGKEMRMGRWQKMTDGKNGAVVFEIPLLVK